MLEKIILFIKLHKITSLYILGSILMVIAEAMQRELYNSFSLAGFLVLVYTGIIALMRDREWVR